MKRKDYREALIVWEREKFMGVTDRQRETIRQALIRAGNPRMGTIAGNIIGGTLVIILAITIAGAAAAGSWALLRGMFGW